MKSAKMVVTISCLIVLIIGEISIYFIVERSERPILVFMFGAIMILFQQIILRSVKKKKDKSY
ncbi:hypothetical protein RCG23_13905 [Neobacillus sp. PS3-34]|uniref:hypothetical protein n=1 Tax=Neobacillus sp. PS3-34 TaxID=3070678 RepID=UPI0027E1B470|nr:hypothetical protein [Neobacillus sp. PS3-34]WML46736.1 hypothetical protein RCG23_13905 [Neobacillus sp. PS3-34]